MSASPGSLPPVPANAGDMGAGVLVTAMETAAAAIYCLTAGDRAPVWANARARSLGTGVGDLPSVDGRSVADLIDSVVRTGRPETVAGPLGPGGPATTVVVRPMSVAGSPGARPRLAVAGA